MADEEKKVAPPEGEKKIDDPKDEPIDDSKPVDDSKPDEGDEPPKPNPAEIKARAYGWVPEEEFSGDKSRWVDAKEFVSRAPLFDRIDHYRRRVESLEGTVQDITKHYKKVDETAYKRAIADLKKEKVQALEDENHARVVELDEALLDLKTEQKETNDQNINPAGPSEAYQAWVRGNTWYDTNPDMRDAADGIGGGYLRRYPGKSEAEIFGHVSQQIRQLFPDAFQNQNRAKPNPVEGAKPNPSQKKKKASWSDLSDIQKQVAKKFVDTGIMTKDQYVEDLRKIGEI